LELSLTNISLHHYNACKCNAYHNSKTPAPIPTTFVLKSDFENEIPIAKNPRKNKNTFATRSNIDGVTP
jgi:hypothetical protein